MRGMRFILCLLLVCCVTEVSAQLYNTAVGIRYGSHNNGGAIGLTVQQRITPQFTIEGILELREEQPILTALLEWHKPLLWKGFNVYFGGGANVALRQVDINNFSYGIDAILGIELKIPLVPLVVSADLKPAIERVDETYTFDWRTGLSARVIIFSDKQKRKRLRRKKKEIRQEKRENFFDDVKEKLPKLPKKED